jgi:hypothetical protein
MILENYPMLKALLDFCYTILIVFVIARYLYYRKKGTKDFLFAFILVSATVFNLCILLVRVKMELGFAIGLFAIFGLIRFRTISVNVREITYLLVCVGIAAKNALTVDSLEAYKILISDIVVIMLIMLLENSFFNRRTMVKTILYTRLDLIHDDKRHELKDDLEASFGIRKIEKVQVGKIDAFKKTAQLKVYFQDTGDNNFSERD